MDDDETPNTKSLYTYITMSDDDLPAVASFGKQWLIKLESVLHPSKTLDTNYPSRI